MQAGYFGPLGWLAGGSPSAKFLLAERIDRGKLKEATLSGRLFKVLLM
jgi:hypothetical protein